MTSVAETARRQLTLPALFATAATAIGLVDGSSTAQIVAQSLLTGMFTSAALNTNGYVNDAMSSRFGSKAPNTLNALMLGLALSVTAAPVGGYLAGQQIAAPISAPAVQ
ncbi:MAG TPA: hypothetical protein EYQ41_04565 [Micavibrio sp.]|nr:hypothetical protein [Micavibrio sp.]